LIESQGAVEQPEPEEQDQHREPQQNHMSDVLIEHPFVIAALLAGAAVISWVMPGLRTTTTVKESA
jgi:hypothetical protein